MTETAANALWVVFTTVPSAEVGRSIARALVEAGEAACVQLLGPLESVYVWQGAVETSAEQLLLVKTTAAAYPAVEARIRSLHPYEVPQIVALPAAAASAPYLQWVLSSVNLFMPRPEA